MNVKKKTFFALTVKLLFSVSLLHAQSVQDSVQKPLPYFFPMYIDTASLKQPLFKNPLPANFYAKQLPFFCSKELQLEKVVGFPIKFRLSTVEYCDKLEGKNR